LFVIIRVESTTIVVVISRILLSIKVGEIWLLCLKWILEDRPRAL
jgi:hypothetical protein